MSQSYLERIALQLIKDAGLPEPIQEFKFCEGRGWRFDFCWPSQSVAIEVDGAIWTKGRHTYGKGYIEDCNKFNEAVLDGWIVLRVTKYHLVSGEAIVWLKRALSEVNRA